MSKYLHRVTLNNHRTCPCSRPATTIRTGLPCCDRCAAIEDHMAHGKSWRDIQTARHQTFQPALSLRAKAFLK